MARLFVAEQVEASSVQGHNKLKASLVGHCFLPKESTGSRDTLLVHNAAILAGVYAGALQIMI